MVEKEKIKKVCKNANRARGIKTEIIEQNSQNRSLKECTILW